MASWGEFQRVSGSFQRVSEGTGDPMGVSKRSQVVTERVPVDLGGVSRGTQRVSWAYQEIPRGLSRGYQEVSGIRIYCYPLKHSLDHLDLLWNYQRPFETSLRPLGTP